MGGRTVVGRKHQEHCEFPWEDCDCIKMSDNFSISYDPKPSGQYTTGYWYAYAEPGYDAAGSTIEDAMAGLIIGMSEALVKLHKEREEAKSE